MKYFIMAVWCLSQTFYAQQEKMFKHLIQKDETLSSIAIKYKVSEADIIKLNPGAEKGIVQNTTLIIPNVNSISYLFKKNDVLAENYSKHQVAAKETLYSISKQHNVTIEDLQNANPDLVKSGLKEGQQLNIPQKPVSNTKKIQFDGKYHEVQSQETLFSIARLYNVAVKDLDALNSETIKNGLQIGQKIEIPNKKKTVDGKARIINKETIFHFVQPKETKYSISKKYGITIEQLEIQNPEIINGLTIGNKLAINKSMVKAKNENEELMIALAEKQAVIEKSKAQTIRIEDLEDRLKVQKELNKKMITLNKLNINLNAIDESKTGSVEKLRLLLDANKKIQEVLIAKLDSLVITMEYDLIQLKNKDIETYEESKKLEQESQIKIVETNKLVSQLKQDLTNNRKIFTTILQKVQRLTVQENKEYKNKVRENLSNKDLASIAQMNKIQEELASKEEKKEALFNKINTIDAEQKTVLKRKIARASFYSAEAREYDDKLAMVKLERMQDKMGEPEKEASVNPVEIRKVLSENIVDQPTKIEVINNLNDLENGFYLVANTFVEAKERDEFALRLSYSGERKTKFFYNVNNFGYYVYTDTFKTLEEALFEYKVKPKTELFKNLFIVQIKKEL